MCRSRPAGVRPGRHCGQAADRPGRPLEGTHRRRRRPARGLEPRNALPAPASPHCTPEQHPVGASERRVTGASFPSLAYPAPELGDRSSLRSGCKSVFLFFAAVLRIVRARSTGSTVLRTAAQPMPCVGASLISSHNPSSACPSGCPGSLGHSYALLRQQAKNNGGEGKLAGHLGRPTHVEGTQP
jgi:hypothetical protein